MRQIAVAVMLVLASQGLGQTPAKESDAVQSLLVEVHQLRMDIEAMTVASQRVQIALYQMQIQDAAVARAAQRVDNARNKCSGVENARQHTSGEIQRFESALASTSTQEAQAKELQSRLAELKSALDTQTTEAQACQTAEADASGQLQNEQVKLTEMQERIEHLDKTLEKLSGAHQ
jgi:chromosome segregation ATPase